MSFAPRVMIASEDLAATKLVQPASRVTYRLAVASAVEAGRAGEQAAQRYLNWAQEQAKGLHGVRIESLESGRPEMRQTLDRAEKFLSLVALLSALLSAVAVALAARSFANSHLDASAMLRVLGQSQRRIAMSYVVEFVCIGLASSLAGVLLGWAVHHVFVWLLAGLLEAALPAAGIWPAALGVGMGMTLLLAFGLPPVLQLAQVPPLRVMRRDLGRSSPHPGWCWAWGGGLCRAVDGGQPRYQAGPDCRRRFRSSRAAVCRPGLAGREAAAPPGQ